MKLLNLLIIFISINCFSQDEFITVWKTDILSNSIIIPITENINEYTYVWEKLDENFNIISDTSESTTIPANTDWITVTFDTPGIYRIKISSESGSFRFFNNGNALGEKLIKIEQWGNINWTTFNNAFKSCSNLDITAYDLPNLTNVTDLSNMFYGCFKLIFNSSISNWEVGTITNFESMFTFAELFNQDLQRWNTSNATNMKNMFNYASKFNQPLGNWDVNNVTNFEGMFHNAKKFNQPLDQWNTSNAIYMAHLFCHAEEFNQNVSHFNVEQVINIS